MLRIAFMLLGGAGLWILFVAGVKPEEMIVGAICVLLTSAFTWYIGCRITVDIRFRIEDLVQIWRMPAYLITGTWEILSVLALDIFSIPPAESLFRAAPFEQNEGPIAVSRRVLAVTYTTATPNFIVVGIDCETYRMLFHQLKRSDVLTMTRRLGAQA